MATTEESTPNAGTGLNRSRSTRLQDVKQRMKHEIEGNKKKGFMTPERKKKLRVMLTNYAKKQLKAEQEIKEKERREIVAGRVGEPKDISKLSDEQLKAVCKEYYQRIQKIESEKWDLEQSTAANDMKVEEINIVVNNLRGKFVKPSLKKVSKNENKFAKLQKKAQEFNFRQTLKVVKKPEFSIKDEEDQGKTKPEWSASKSKSFCSEAPPDSPTIAKKTSSSSSDSGSGTEE